jgi:ABC-type transporter MlaC component
MHRRAVLLGAGALTLVPATICAAQTANAAESFVHDNIQSGFDILNDRNARRRRSAATAFALFFSALPM